MACVYYGLWTYRKMIYLGSLQFAAFCVLDPWTLPMCAISNAMQDMEDGTFEKNLLLQYRRSKSTVPRPKRVLSDE